jgi:hypothetical protein
MGLVCAALLAPVGLRAQATAVAEAELPDAPGVVPAGAGAVTPGLAPALGVTVRAAASGGGGSSAAGSALLATPPEDTAIANCPYATAPDRACGVHWHQLAISGSLYLAFQNTGNVYSGYWYRHETLTGKWWDRYVNSVEGWRWKVWSDDNPFLDDYVGHPMMGAITNALWIQNDPKGMTLEQSNSWAYWRSRLRATAFSAAFSFEWKLGPVGEASIGHNGDHYFYDKDVYTNETGWVELVTTPVGGLVWTLGEDALDRTLVRRLESRPRGPLTLLGISFLTPARATGNILRFRPPWYRDSRVVKANSFWSDPVEDKAVPVARGSRRAPASSSNGAATSGASGGGVVAVRGPVAAAMTGPPGGVHEFGATWGLSLMSGHLWGTVGDVKYMPIALRYSYRLRQTPAWELRYSPEFVAMAMIDWPSPTPLSDPNYILDQRTRAYGSGASPVGFEAELGPAHRVQPFVGTNEGLVIYDQPVLSATGPRVLYDIDFGAGVHVFRKLRQSVTIGYRYQHLMGGAGAGSVSTDANTFYVGVSRFRTKQ